MSMRCSHTVPEAKSGGRLDAFVAHACGCGLRAAKRLIADGAVRIDGAIRPARYKLRAGDVVAICRETPPASPDTLAVAGMHGEYLAFIKPAGLHTARITGSAEPSLEQTLAAQWVNRKDIRLPPQNEHIPEVLRAALGAPAQDKPLHAAALPPQAPQLLSRLDAMTSGLVLAASSGDAAEIFRQMEARGEVNKYYLAVIDGILEQTVTATHALDTANRARTRVLPQADPDATRHTAVCPLGVAASFAIPGAGNETTLAAVRIKRGSRHQIRAHLAHLGFPIAGDTVYGRKTEEATFRLHHARLELPECSFFCLPSWLSFP